MKKNDLGVNLTVKREADGYISAGLNERTHFLVPENENYTCGHCGETVTGGRYNNHCPRCLWSKHLDERIPGDRVSKCRALMEPVGVTQRNGTWRIVHQCTGCKKNTVVDSSPKDDFNFIVKLSQHPLP